jgi:hypothetical protein
LLISRVSDDFKSHVPRPSYCLAILGHFYYLSSRNLDH